MHEVGTRTLRDGSTLPAVGYGTGVPLSDQDAPGRIADALLQGYRMIDTAERYGNEVGVGAGIKQSGVRREDIVVQTKFQARWQGRRNVKLGWAETVRRLDVDYLDLYLMHWPNPSIGLFAETWEGLIELREEGKVRSLGTSNFSPDHIDELIRHTAVAPVVNQIQVNPAVTAVEQRAYHAEHGILTESWGPLGQKMAWLPAGEPGSIMHDPAVLGPCRTYGKSPVQVVLRWHVELGLLPLPASDNPEQTRQNLDVFDFALTPEEVSAISALDQGDRAKGPQPDVHGH